MPARKISDLGAAAGGDLALDSLFEIEPASGTPSKNLSGTQLAALLAMDVIGPPTGLVDINGQRLTSVGTPSADTDAATKAYVDATAQGLQIKDAVRVATTADITLENEQTIDGVSAVAGDRVLVKNQIAGAENGIYDVVDAGPWVRSDDASVDAEVVSGIFCFVEEGTVNADSGWVLTTNNPITLDTTALTFTQFSGAGQITAGDGLAKSGNTLSAVVDDDTLQITTDQINIKAANLLALHGLTGAANKGTHFTGAGAMALHDLTAYARTLLAASGITTILPLLGVQLKVVASDVSTTLDTPQDITGLSFSIGANERWFVASFFYTECNNSGGIKYAIGGPTGALPVITVLGSSTSSTAYVSRIHVALDTLTSAAYNNVNSIAMLIQGGSILASSTPGTVQLKFASNTSGQTSTIKAGSVMLAIRIA